MTSGADTRGTFLVDPALMRQAEERCHRRLEQDAEDRAALWSLAEIHRKLGRLDEAAATYSRIFRLDPLDEDAGYLQAVLGGTERPKPITGIRAAPFVRLPEFLPPDFHQSLLPHFTAVRDRFVPVKQSQGYRPDARQTLELPGEWEGRKPFTARILDVLPRVLPRLYLPPFTMGEHEVQVRAYQDGHFFKTHRDADPDFPGANRMINFVYYFHKLPRPYSGGELLLFDSDDVEVKGRMTMSRFTSVVPEDNSVVFFPAHFYHCVLPIRCPSRDFSDSRFVINGHFHKRASQPGG